MRDVVDTAQATCSSSSLAAATQQGRRPNKPDSRKHFADTSQHKHWDFLIGSGPSHPQVSLPERCMRMQRSFKVQEANPTISHPLHDLCLLMYKQTPLPFTDP